MLARLALLYYGYNIITLAATAEARSTPVRVLFVLLLSSLLVGCITSSPQKALYKAEYPHRQDIRQKNVYQFKTTPIKASGERYWGAGELTQLFRVNDKDASTVQLRFNYPAKSLEAVSLDAANRTLSKETFILLDESAPKPSSPETNYFYLTKDGQLVHKIRNCTPDMSVGCQWWNHRLFITRNGDMAVHYENGSAVLLFLVFPGYGSHDYLEIFSKVSPVANVTS